jgi:transglutaminase-like putative cysteine protease
MIYDIKQTTSNAYESAVSRAHHLLHLVPVARNRQRIESASLDIDPLPARRREATDFFANRTTVVEIEEPHQTLTVTLEARIAVEAVAASDAAQTPPWESVRAETYTCADIGPSSPVHFIYPSRLVPLDPDIRDYARESFAPGRPVLVGADELMRRIKRDFTYQPGATTVTTTPSMAFTLRRGVCQDFAHIMISGLRGLGLPAAYVSGYLRTVPRPGAAGLAGADAMHAWVMVWCGAAADRGGAGSGGWWGLDPTNALIASEDHVMLAIGRDYADVYPINGVVVASGQQRVSTAVKVMPVEG